MLESKKASNTWKKRIEEPPHRKSQHQHRTACVPIYYTYILLLVVV